MTIEDLHEFGFKEWPIAQHDKHDRHWQYCIRDQHGKKFYVQVRLWKFSKYSSPTRGIVDDSFDAYVQFTVDEETFNVDLSVRHMCPQQIVDWFDNLFTKMGCSYYEKYNEYDHLDEAFNHNICSKCRRYLKDSDVIIAEGKCFCQTCKYEVDTGFKPGITIRKKS